MPYSIDLFQLLYQTILDNKLSYTCQYKQIRNTTCSDIQSKTVSMKKMLLHSLKVKANFVFTYKKK